MSPAYVRTVAVGRPRSVPRPWNGVPARTAIWKDPVEGTVAVGDENLEGDEQADRVNHGGRDKSVYAYGVEDIAFWRGELGAGIDDAMFGQNLTTVGYPLREAVVGERWHIGTAVLEVAQPRIPCFKLGMRAGDRTMPARFIAAERPGVYLRVHTRGVLRAGDPITVTDRPGHGVTVSDVFRIFLRERDEAARLLDAPELPSRYHDWARGRRPSR